MFDILNMIFEYFNHGGEDYWGYVELAGTVGSLICVYLAVKQNIWTWFWGAIGVTFYGPMFLHYGLYSDAALNLAFFLPIQALGYYWWKTKGPTANDDLPVKRTEVSTNIMIVVGIIFLAAVTGFYTSGLEGVAFPYADALTTWMSVFAQVLMIKKYFESWVLWVAMDVIAIPIYFMKGMAVVSGTYAVFFVLATMGGIAWYKSWKEQQHDTV